MSDNVKYEIIEGIRFKVRFADKYISIGDSHILSIDSIMSDYFWKYWHEHEYEIPLNNITYNFILYEREIYSVNRENFNWRVSYLKDMKDKANWKGYLEVGEDNSLIEVYSELYKSVLGLSSFKTKKENSLIIIKIIKMANKRDLGIDFLNSSNFKDYRDLYLKLKSNYDTLKNKSIKFLEKIEGKTKVEIDKIFKKSVYNTRYFRILYVHNLRYKNSVETYLEKHENLYDLLK